MKKIIKYFIILLIFVPFFIKAETQVIENTKLREAIMSSFDKINIDSNGDNKLSLSEINNYSGNLNLDNNSLSNSDIQELNKFTNLTGLSLANNNLSDLSPVLSLTKLNYLAISGNPYRCSFINGFEKCEQLYELKEMLNNNGGNVAASGLLLAYDSSNITASTPKYKVLVTIVKDIDTDVTFLKGGSGHTEYHMDDIDISLIKEYIRLFEMYVEKLTNYKIDLLVDYYITKDTITTLEPSGSSVEGQESSIFPSDIPEISNIINDYDTGMVVAYTHFNTHSFSGLAGWNNSRGEVFIPYDQNMYVFMLDSFQYITQEERNKLFTDLGTTYDQFLDDVNDTSINTGNTITGVIKKLKNTAIKRSMEAKIIQYRNNNVQGAEIDTFIHEFTHTLEFYNSVRGYNTWEFHNALRFGEEYPGLKMNVSDTYDYEGLYLNGYARPEDETEKGINSEIYNNPPTKFYTTTLGSISAPTVEINVDEDEVSNTITWSNVSDATQYKLFKGTDKNKLNEIIYFSSDNTYKDTNIVVGTKYYYKVVAIQSSGEECVRSADSNIVEALVSPKTVDVSPVLEIESLNDKVILTWNNVSNATNYVVKRSTSISGIYSTIKSGNINTFTDSNLAYGKTYYYKVIAENEISSKESNIVSKKIAPIKVSNLALKPANKAITISWDKVSGNGYEVYYSLNNSKWTKLKTITSAKTTSIKHKKLSVNKKYYYKVRAYKTVNGKKIYGDYSDVLSTKTAPKKTKLKASSKEYNNISLSINEVSGAANYKIYRSTSKTKGFKVIGTTDTTKYNDTTVIPTIKYYYKVKACNSYGACGDYSSVVNKKSSLKTINDLNKNTDNNSVTLTFSEIPGAMGYQIYRSTSKTKGFKKIGTTDTTEYNDTSVKVNKKYYYKVRSFITINGKKYYSSYSKVISAKVSSN